MSKPDSRLVCDISHRPQPPPGPTAPFTLHSAAQALGMGITQPGQRRGEGRAHDNALFGFDLGERCHFSNLTRGEIKRWWVMRWCYVAGIAFCSAATALPRSLRGTVLLENSLLACLRLRGGNRSRERHDAAAAAPARQPGAWALPPELKQRRPAP